MPSFENVTKVDINEARWWIGITVVDQQGNEHDFVASADRAYTEGDGIWFGTREDYNKGPEW